MKIITILFILTSSIYFGQEDKYKVLEQKKGSSLIKIIENSEYGNLGYVINQTVFDVKYLIRDSVDSYFLIEKNIEETRYLGHENSTTFQDVKMYNLDDIKKPILSFKKKCDDVYFHDDFFETITYGCCASLHEIKLFDYNNKEIFTSHNGVSILMNNYQEMLIGLEFLPVVENTSDSLCLLNFYMDSLNKWEFLIKNSDSLSKKLYHFEDDFPTLTIEQNNQELTLFPSPNFNFDLYYLQDDSEKISFTVNLLFKMHLLDNYENEIVKTRLIEIPFYNFKPYGKNQHKFIIDLKDL